MNHLAHAWLAMPDDDIVLGGLMADFLRGAVDPQLPRGVRIGIALHRAIDGYTDAHPQVVAARRLFEPPYRRYAGILIDVWFDHLLARRWTRHADGSVASFSQHVQRLLAARDVELPPRLQDFARYMRRHDLPAAYQDVETIDRVFNGLSHRLSRENPLATARPVLAAQSDALEHAFAQFFPQLAAFSAGEVARIEARLA
ncbi:MAG: ACP phosphodiesterase [Dokdonella sp.]|uniref:acyl carrier protein phosphodiesterase n=1 Tax=Dokdonella sp. TaxID=2291710 RepID=UPI0032666B4E